MERSHKKGNTAATNALDIKNILLQNISEDAPPTKQEQTPRAASKIRWPSLKDMLGSLNGSVTEKDRNFEIKCDELKFRDKIGEGIRSLVFAAELKTTNKKVVVKQLHTEFDRNSEEKQQRVVQDLEAVAVTLSHPNIVELVGVNFSQQTGAVNLVYETMGGGTLEAYLDGKPRPKLPQMLNWSIQLFNVLSFLHLREQPIIHRDIKPSHLLLSADLKTLKLSDFGVRRIVTLGIRLFKAANLEREIVTDVSRLTRPASCGFSGTARFVAPEVDIKLKCPEAPSPAVDVYSAALVMWTLVEGKRPWEQVHGYSAALVAQTGRRPKLRTDGAVYPSELAALITCCWDQNPLSRPRAADVVFQLQAIQQKLVEAKRLW